jgi:hypothetical protein
MPPLISCTIRAVEPRRLFALALQEQIRSSTPRLDPQIFWSQGPIGRASACENFRRALDYACQSSADYWLCLEDDQELEPIFFHSLLALVCFAHRTDALMLYLSNREVPRSPMRIDGVFSVCPLPFPVAGAHGLLIRADVLPRLKTLAAARAIFTADGLIWDALKLTSNVPPLQIVKPILMRHLPGPSTLGHDAPPSAASTPSMKSTPST